MTVEKEPMMNANSNDPVSFMTRRRLESKSKRGIASGIRNRFVKSSMFHIRQKRNKIR